MIALVTSGIDDAGRDAARGDEPDEDQAGDVGAEVRRDPPQRPGPRLARLFCCIGGRVGIFTVGRHEKTGHSLLVGAGQRDGSRPRALRARGRDEHARGDGGRHEFHLPSVWLPDQPVLRRTGRSTAPSDGPAWAYPLRRPGPHERAPPHRPPPHHPAGRPRHGPHGRPRHGPYDHPRHGPYGHPRRVTTVTCRA